jgi:hypothetical protein
MVSWDILPQLLDVGASAVLALENATLEFAMCLQPVLYGEAMQVRSARDEDMAEGLKARQTVTVVRKAACI